MSKTPEEIITDMFAALQQQLTANAQIMQNMATGITTLSDRTTLVEQALAAQASPPAPPTPILPVPVVEQPQPHSAIAQVLKTKAIPEFDGNHQDASTVRIFIAKCEQAFEILGVLEIDKAKVAGMFLVKDAFG